MTKINITTKTLEEVAVKYCKISLTEDKPTWHRLVENTDGSLEYQMGIGKQKNVTMRSFRTLVRSIVQALKAHQIEYCALHLDIKNYPKLSELGAEWFFRTLGENLELAQYEFKKYKTGGKKDDYELKEILVCSEGGSVEKQSFSTGLTIGQAANLARDIANTCGDDLTPSGLATAAKTALKGTKATVKVLNKKAIKAEKMGLLEAVGKGASDEPNLIVIEYWGFKKPTPATKNDETLKPVVLIGKGITYDTGGLNVKPSGFMHEMHMDMTGAATIIAAMQAIVKLGVKKNVVAIIPAAENAISATSMRAGDIVTSMSGKTVEILHTDAEGRLVLADAMTYASKYYSPRVMLDVATLTGASLVALGQFTSAFMTKNKPLSDTLIKLGEETGDLMWPLPLWDEYKQSLKSYRADVSNIATNFARTAGCIEGAAFLSHFAPKKTSWAHIDIAPRMDSIPNDKLVKGATGEPVRLLVKFVETY